MTFWPPFFSLSQKRSMFGNNKAYDTFSPDGKITLTILPFILSEDMVMSHPTSPTRNVYTAKRLVYDCLAMTIKKKLSPNENIKIT